MAGETRYVNRCTYTPISNSPEVGDDKPGFVAKQPFLKLNLLRSVFDRPKIGELVLERLGRDETNIQDLDDAVRHSWNGDYVSAVKTMRNVDLSTVRSYANAALTAHGALLDQADQDLDTAINELASDREQHVAELAGVNLKTVGVDIRRAILDGLRREPLLGPFGVKGLVNQKPSLAQPVDTDGTRAIVAAASLSTIRRTDVQERLAARAPQTARLLSAQRYFALPKVASVLATTELTRFYISSTLERFLLNRKRDLLLGIDLLGRQEPVGFLHLERLHFTPIGYVLGELVYSLPMVPREVVRLSHREWTRTAQEYATLVATSLETARQDTLSEKTELTESVTAQQQHGSTFNTSVTASGGFGPVQVSSAVGYSATNANSRSTTQTAAHAQEITRAAATRSKEEHKVSFKISTEQEVEDVSYRELRNDTDLPVRWDFRRLLQKWQIDLYRYDVRLTYEVIVPEPGSYILRRHIEIDRLRRLLSQPFALQPATALGFSGSATDITRDNWIDLSAHYNVGLDAPPDQYVSVGAHAEQTFSARVVGFDYVELSLPEGYTFSDWDPTGTSIQTDEDHPRSAGKINPLTSANRIRLQNGAKNSNTYLWQYSYDWSEEDTPTEGSVISIGIWARGKLSDKAFNQWKMASYQRIVDAARGQDETDRQRMQKRLEELEADLARYDALSLRQLETEELMKGVLRWLFGDKFSFHPGDQVPLDLGDKNPDGTVLAPDGTLVPIADLGYYDRVSGRVVGGDAALDAMARHGDMIRFLHHAIEWENVNSVLYPYFWTDVPRWDFKEAFFHGDPQHRAFLRAGAARVVLTIRPNYEKAFLSFMESGTLDAFDENAEYISVAEERKQLALTNYPYTPAANEENPKNKVDSWFEFTPTSALDVRAGTVLDGDS